MLTGSRISAPRRAIGVAFHRDEGEARRGDRLERLGERRGDRQPGDDQHEQGEQGEDDPLPAPAQRIVPGAFRRPGRRLLGWASRGLILGRGRLPLGCLVQTHSFFLEHPAPQVSSPAKAGVQQRGPSSLDPGLRRGTERRRGNRVAPPCDERSRRSSPAPAGWPAFPSNRSCHGRKARGPACCASTAPAAIAPRRCWNS